MATNKYRWKSDGKLHSIPESQHIKNVAAAKRQPGMNLGDVGGVPGSRYTGFGGQQTPGNVNTGATNPTYATPAPMGAVTPIAAPPVLTAPSLTLTDQANQAIELADVQGYLDDIHKQTTDAQIAATQKLGDIGASRDRNLESADWNTAARGLGQSSIRDTTKANIGADASRAETATSDAMKNQTDYEAGAIKRGADAVTNINTKYAELAKQNAQAASDANPPAPAGPTDPESQAAAPAGTSTPPRTEFGTSMHISGPSADYKPVVKDGKFYHVYPDGTWIYIRKAS